MDAKLLGVMTLLLAMTVESVAQVSLKIGASGGPAILVVPFRLWVGKFRLLSSAAGWTALGVLLYVLEILLYTLVLHWLDVSVAFPMGSLCFVGVTLLSKILLGEAVDRVRWLGVLCIIAGTAIMAL